MIKVTVLYPYEEGAQFDHEYWNTSHRSLIQKLLGPAGFIKGELETGISSSDPNTPAPFTAIAHLYFNTTDEVHEAFKTHAGPIMKDASNYTTITPLFQISEILE